MTTDAPPSASSGPEERTTGRVLAFSWLGDELRFALPALDDGRTRFTLVNVLEARDIAARNAAGWHVCLRALSQITPSFKRRPSNAYAVIARPLSGAALAAAWVVSLLSRRSGGSSRQS